MLTYELINWNYEQDEKVITAIEDVIKQFGLSISQKTTLSTKKGSVHYHLKKGKEAGILEITFWSKHKQLLVEIHDNRHADWNLEMIKPLSDALAHRFDGIAEKS